MPPATKRENDEILVTSSEPSKWAIVFFAAFISKTLSPTTSLGGERMARDSTSKEPNLIADSGKTLMTFKPFPTAWLESVAGCGRGV